MSMPTEPEALGTEGAGPGGRETNDRAGQFEPGQLLFGRYLAVRQLGRGGMGTVWLVRHRELDAERALKIIAPEVGFTPEALGRFRREARVMARLSHPHAVIVHDAQIDRDVAFIEMEYIPGRGLDVLVRPGVPLPIDWVARVLVQLCDVLQAAHDRQIVHRDLKPSNLMLLDGHPPAAPFLKVLDFGIAKVLAPDGPLDVRTHTGAFLGTPAYMSPEQVRGEPVDGRSDLYSTGVILYELISGRRPFTGALPKLVHDHLHTPPPPLTLPGDVPPEVERVILRCLAKAPGDRPRSARELAEEFLQAVSRTRIAATCPGSPTQLPPEPRFDTPGDTQPMTTQVMSSSGDVHPRQDSDVIESQRPTGDPGRGERRPRPGPAGRPSPSIPGLGLATTRGARALALRICPGRRGRMAGPSSPGVVQ